MTLYSYLITFTLLTCLSSLPGERHRLAILRKKRAEEQKIQDELDSVKHLQLWFLYLLKESSKKACFWKSFIYGPVELNHFNLDSCLFNFIEVNFFTMRAKMAGYLVNSLVFTLVRVWDISSVVYQSIFLAFWAFHINIKSRFWQTPSFGASLNVS